MDIPITITLAPKSILIAFLVIAIILMMVARFWPENKPVKKLKTRSPKEIEKLEKEIQRLKKAMK